MIGAMGKGLGQQQQAILDALTEHEAVVIAWLAGPDRASQVSARRACHALAAQGRIRAGYVIVPGGQVRLIATRPDSTIELRRRRGDFMSNRQIAAALGVSESTVRRARQDQS